MIKIKININGVQQDIDAEPDMPLLWALRDVLHLNGTKFGCGMALCILMASQCARARPWSVMWGRRK
jgi:aerobic-type carbon monoxide dehydrogenase small subunit (CoxS/CutS family)